MTETAEIKLARVEEKLDVLVSWVEGLRDDVKAFATRITKLEESTREAVPQVWKLRERVARLELETAQLRLDLEQLTLNYEERRQAAGSRWWDVVRMILGPVLGAIAGWIAATLQRGLGR